MGWKSSGHSLTEHPECIVTFCTSKHDDNNNINNACFLSLQTALKTTFRPPHHMLIQPISSLQKPAIIRCVIDFLESYCFDSCIKVHKEQFGM